MTVMAVPLVKAAGESGPTYFFLFIYPEVPAPDADCRSVNTSSDYGNRTASQTALSPLVITWVNQEALPNMPKPLCFLPVARHEGTSFSSASRLL